MNNYLDIKNNYNKLLKDKEKLENELNSYSFDNIKIKAKEKINTIVNNYRSFRSQIDPLLSKIEKLSKGNFQMRKINRIYGNYSIDTLVSTIEEQKRNIIAILKIISTNGLSNKAMEKLNEHLGVLKDVEYCFHIVEEEYFDSLLANAKENYDTCQNRIKKVNKQINDLEILINEKKSTIEDEVEKFKFNNLLINDKYDKEIIIPISLKESKIDTIIQYWNPIKENTLIINTLNDKKETESNVNNLIKSSIIHFLFSYPNLNKKVFYCCKQANDDMDKLLGLLSQDGKDEKSKGLGNTVFYHGITQIEAKNFERDVEDQFTYLREEAKNRSVLFEKENVSNIYDYNSLEDISIKDPILVILNNFPNGFEGCVDLEYLLKEGPNYGIFFIIINAFEKEEKYFSNKEIDVTKFTNAIYGVDERGLIINNDSYNVGILGNKNILELINPLVKIKNKKKSITYEKIGFGNETREPIEKGTVISIPVAKCDNEIYNIEFGAGGNSPIAYLLLGAPGTGKSSLLDSLIMNGAMAYSPDDLNFYLLDFKDGMLSKPYEGENAIPHVRLIAAENKEEDADILLNNLIEEKERRNKIFKETSANNIAEYNKKATKRMPRIIVVIDECYPIFSNTDLEAKSELLIKQGRSTGIHFILASQDLKRMSNILKFINGRFCYYVDEDEAKEMINPKYAQLVSSEIPKGSHKVFASNNAGKDCVIITPAFHLEKQAYYNKMIKDKWLPQGYENGMIVVGEKSRLDILEATKEKNILKQENKEIIPFGEDYFSHKLSSFKLEEKNNHSIVIVGEDEKVNNDILTSIMIGALRNNAKIHLIDESNDRDVHNIFGSHPLVYSTLEDGYLEALSDFNNEFNKQIKDRRTKYDPYYLIINCLNYISDFELDKEYKSSSNFDDDFETSRPGRISISARYNSRIEEEEKTKIKGRETLFNILQKIKNVNNMFIILVMPSSDIFKNHNEREIIQDFAYKIVQNKVNSSVGDILNEGFRTSQLNNLNENLVYVSKAKEYSKVRIFRYDFDNNETKRLIIDSVKGG